MERHRDDPFVLLGVNSDPDRTAVLRTAPEKRFPGRSWFDGGTRGPIAKQWNIRGWPAIFVIDADGVIRARDVRGDALDDAIATCLEAIVDR